MPGNRYRGSVLIRKRHSAGQQRRCSALAVLATVAQGNWTVRILVAEDEKDIRDLIVFTLRDVAGFDVHEAVNGADVVEKAPLVVPDLILLDVRMPKVNGYEACALIKGMAYTQHIPIVFLSAKGQESEINTGLEMGAEAYILKPFAPEELIAQVQAIMEKVKKRRAKQTP